MVAAVVETGEEGGDGGWLCRGSHRCAGNIKNTGIGIVIAESGLGSGWTEIGIGIVRKIGGPRQSGANTGYSQRTLELSLRRQKLRKSCPQFIPLKAVVVALF